MNGAKTKILLISSSAKTGGGPSHIFLLNELLKDEFDLYLAMSNLLTKNNAFDNKKYLEISERRISLMDIKRLVILSIKNSIDIIHAHGKGAGLIIRKEPKGHGTQSQVEGPLPPVGTTITVLEDVTTTGGSAIKAAKVLRDLGYHVNRVVTIVDRQESASDAMIEEGLELVSLVTLEDLTNDT